MIHTIPYIANIFILVPVVLSLLRPGMGQVAVFDYVADVPVLRVMIASLWTGVLALSAVALFDPLAFWPLLTLQVVYKVFFLAIWVAPRWRTQHTAIPMGITIVFALIVVIWPFFIVAALQSQ